MRLNLDSAMKLSEQLVKSSDIIESELNKVQTNFKVLGETFKDMNYSEFQSELSAADRTIETVRSDILSLNTALLNYVEAMRELLIQNQ